MIVHKLLFAALVVLASPLAVGDELADQRSTFIKAEALLAKGDPAGAFALASGIRDYPLYPYLRYQYLRTRLTRAPTAEIAEFVTENSGSYAGERLRTEWLRHLGRTGQWQTYKDYYVEQTEVTLQCWALTARLRTGNPEGVAEDTIPLWLVGKSQPPECDPAFEHLGRSRLMTPALVWDRIRLAVAAGETGLVNHLARRLPASDARWVPVWLAVHSDPKAGLGRAELASDDARAREIVVYGLKRLAAKDPRAADARWEMLRRKLTFTLEDEAAVLRELALAAARANLPEAEAWLDRVPPAFADATVQNTMLRIGIGRQNWPALASWTRMPAASGVEVLRWGYWRARALEHTGDVAEAKRIYRELADERDYYGFKAADRLGLPYNMRDRRYSFPPGELELIREHPSIRRAREFYVLGRHLEARREWHFGLRTLLPHQIPAAATIAHEWGWHDRAIITLAKSESLDDLELRFPTPFKPLVMEYSAKRGLSPGLVYSLMRSESAFQEDAISPAGALGLMQIMPATGRQTAKSIGLPLERAEDLLRGEINVPLGTAYLRQMLDRFGGNVAMAAAAYNAGPGRVLAWQPSTSCLPAEIWIETIPFTETHRYVRRVLFYNVIYAWRMEQSTPQLESLADTIPAKSLDRAACTA